MLSAPNPSICERMGFSAARVRFWNTRRSSGRPDTLVVDPARRHPLRLALQRVDFGQQLVISSFRVVIYDYHVKQVSPARLHIARGGDDVLQLLILPKENGERVSTVAAGGEIGREALTLYGSPLRIFFWRSFSRLGGATKTTYGFKSDARNSFKLCGCKLRTQIFSLETTARIASSEVPAKENEKRRKLS